MFNHVSPLIIYVHERSKSLVSQDEQPLLALPGLPGMASEAALGLKAEKKDAAHEILQAGDWFQNANIWTIWNIDIGDCSFKTRLKRRWEKP